MEASNKTDACKQEHLVHTGKGNVFHISWSGTRQVLCVRACVRTIRVLFMRYFYNVRAMPIYLCPKVSSLKLQNGF